MGFFSALGMGLGFGGGTSAGYTLANHYIQPPRSRAISSQVVAGKTLTIMQYDAWGQAPRWALYVIWDGHADVVGKFTSWPQLQAGFQTIGTYLNMGGNREHFWAQANLPEGAPPIPLPSSAVIDYPDA